ncbi:hypothetical protein AVEN_33019-1 [Araneus ventricosus]|uniref:Uncharacterized protein n=1 Tax=Araneus ventricosus TaxID=182803 RepID=A0A4Y2N824_ARAVE|nr:hypothetical protein AVEN_33019-1 [Araneus ventricosus]
MYLFEVTQGLFGDELRNSELWLDYKDDTCAATLLATFPPHAIMRLLDSQNFQHTSGENTRWTSIESSLEHIIILFLRQDSPL